MFLIPKNPYLIYQLRFSKHPFYCFRFITEVVNQYQHQKI